jgi:nicotinamidase-related amidase
VRHFVLLQDTHDPGTPEFNAYPPHCVRGTGEAETIAALQSLSFSDDYTVIEKNSLNPAIATGFDAWLDDHPTLNTAIVVGDCTDLCTHQLAMHLRMRANANNLTGYRVIVPADCVDTYDLSPEAASESGAMPHPADFFHPVFLYHLALNGIEVVTSLP